MSVPPQLQRVLDNVDKRLHDPCQVSNVLSRIEQKTGARRLHVVVGLIVAVALYLILGHFAALLCNTMGFVYPAFCSFGAVESLSRKDVTQWLTYWIVFAVLSVIEFFSAQILSVFPLYWLIKTIFLLWLYLPSSLGATKIYQSFIKPVFLKHHRSDQRKGGIADKAKDATRNALDEASTHLD